MEKPNPASGPAETNPANPQDGSADAKAFETARQIAILHAAIRRVPEQNWPSSCQYAPTHR